MLTILSVCHQVDRETETLNKSTSIGNIDVSIISFHALPTIEFSCPDKKNKKRQFKVRSNLGLMSDSLVSDRMSHIDIDNEITEVCIA